MKRTFTHIVAALVIGALLGSAALAGTKTKNVRFDDNVTVNGTLLKKGTYKVAFNDETNELTISRGSKVLVKTTAKLEDYKQTTAAYAPDYKTRKEGDTLTLTHINLGGAYAVVGEEGGSTSGSK
jgi:hypothetical protein